MDNKNDKVILVIGAEASGKTVLVDALCRTCLGNSEVLSAAHAPTVGVNLSKLHDEQHKDGGNLFLRELGGCMAPIWSDFFGDISKTVFVVDSSNPMQAAASLTLFSECLKNQNIRQLPFVLVLAKTDLQCSLTDVEILDILLCHKLQRLAISILSCSAVSGVGIPSLIKWIRHEA